MLLDVALSTFVLVGSALAVEKEREWALQVECLGCRDWGTGSRVENRGFGVLSFGDWGSGFRIWGLVIEV